MSELNREARFLPQNPEVPSLLTSDIGGPLPFPFLCKSPLNMSALFQGHRHLPSKHSSKCAYQLPIVLCLLDVKNSKCIWFKQEVWLFPSSQSALVWVVMISFCSDNDLEIAVLCCLWPPLIYHVPKYFHDIYVCHDAILYKPLSSHPKTSRAFWMFCLVYAPMSHSSHNLITTHQAITIVKWKLDLLL